MSDPFSLAGRRAIVTGAARGIGRAIATALHRAGAAVWISDIDGPAAVAAAAALGGRAGGGALDVTNAAAVAAAFDAAEAALGPLDLVVANAGISTMNRVVDLTEAEWDANMAVNAKGVFLVDQCAVRRFLARGTRGSSSTPPRSRPRSAPLLAHYSASKFAVVGFTQALAREVAADGIRVNAVCPGFVRTGMQEREIAWESRLRGLSPDEVVADYVRQTPLGRLEEPEDVADVVVFLASDAARFMTGQAINVTGGVYTT